MLILTNHVNIDNAWDVVLQGKWSKCTRISILNWNNVLFTIVAFSFTLNGFGRAIVDLAWSFA